MAVPHNSVHQSMVPWRDYGQPPFKKAASTETLCRPPQSHWKTEPTATTDARSDEMRMNAPLSDSARLTSLQRTSSREERRQALSDLPFCPLNGLLPAKPPF